MNEYFIIGKVVNEPVFKFFYMKKDISICYFKIKEKDNIIDVSAYNNLADAVYQKIHKDQLLFIYGHLRKEKKKIFVEIESFKIL